MHVQTSAFEAGILEYSVPSHVRTDRGEENVEIAQFVLLEVHEDEV